jgi:hypothetical protein
VPYCAGAAASDVAVKLRARYKLLAALSMDIKQHEQEVLGSKAGG